MPDKRDSLDPGEPINDDPFGDDDFLENEESLDEEMELYEQQLEAHPEYAEFIESDEDPFATCVGETGEEMSPYLHIQFHMILERQLRAGDPACVRETMERLLARGDDPHEAQHAILNVLVVEMWDLLQGGRKFDEIRYCEELKKI